MKNIVHPWIKYRSSIHTEWSRWCLFRISLIHVLMKEGNLFRYSVCFDKSLLILYRSADCTFCCGKYLKSVLKVMMMMTSLPCESLIFLCPVQLNPFPAEINFEAKSHIMHDSMCVSNFELKSHNFEIGVDINGCKLSTWKSPHLFKMIMVESKGNITVLFAGWTAFYDQLKLHYCHSVESWIVLWIVHINDLVFGVSLVVSIFLSSDLSWHDRSSVAHCCRAFVTFQ